MLDPAYVDNYAIMVSPAVGADKTKCGRESWNETVPYVRKQDLKNEL